MTLTPFPTYRTGSWSQAEREALRSARNDYPRLAQRRLAWLIVWRDSSFDIASHRKIDESGVYRRSYDSIYHAVRREDARRKNLG